MKANSWDCFDTLIARNLITPSSIFDIVGKKIGDPDFTDKRKKAEKSSSGTYLDIYKNIPDVNKDLELEAELENCYPIIENMNRVKDGDYIVSDMYLPESFIREMLKKCGLKKDVNLIVTRGGKHKGNIWVDLKDKILNHTGDHIKSDCRNAEMQGIKSTYYLEQKMNDPEINIFNTNQDLAGFSRKLRLSQNDLYEEKWVHSHGFFKKLYNNNWYEQLNVNLESRNPIILYFKEIDRNENYILLKRPDGNRGVADRNREVYVKIYKDHLSIKFHESNEYKTLYKGYWENPYELNRIDRKTLWQEQANINIPSLIIGSNILKNINPDQEYIFNYRDAYFLKKIYDKLWNKSSDHIHSSRILYYYPTQDYIAYLKDKLKNNNVIVDIQGSGASTYEFLNNNNNINFKVIFLYSLLHTSPDPNIFSKICSGKRIYFDTEKFNLYSEGTLIGWENNKPIRSILECKTEVFETQESAVNLACEQINNFNLKNIYNIDLMKSVSNFINGSYTSKIVPTGPSTARIKKHGLKIANELEKDE